MCQIGLTNQQLYAVAKRSSFGAAWYDGAKLALGGAASV